MANTSFVSFTATETTMPYALVVDDHPLVASGMANYLMTHCGYVLVHVASHHEQCLQRIQTDGSPTLIVLDFWLTADTALGLMQTLQRLCPSAAILVVSGDVDAGILAKVRQVGASGFISKHETPEVFAKAVRTVCAGGYWFQTAYASTTYATPQARELPIHPSELGLTARQGQVLSLVLRGQPNKHIAQILSVSEATVKEHITNILAKLHMTKRSEVIQLLRGRRIEPDWVIE